MTQLQKTVVLISLLASVSTYACEWKNKSKAQKTMAQVTVEQPKTYASSWSDARSSKLLQFSPTQKESISVERKVADNKNGSTSFN